MNKTHMFVFSAIFGTIFGLIIVVFFDYKVVLEKGFFQGYTTIVWIVVFLQVDSFIYVSSRNFFFHLNI